MDIPAAETTTVSMKDVAIHPVINFALVKTDIIDMVTAQNTREISAVTAAIMPARLDHALLLGHIWMILLGFGNEDYPILHL